MLSNILNLTNSKTLNKNEQKSINGGHFNCAGRACRISGNGDAYCCGGATCRNNVCGYWN
ncbi:hypothetical protein [Aquimarina macrocephali]|uniref:hypothetical protein n=1 Tax=Aquimarina macrocephali TaxID=666563 RepID=UPI0004ADA56A|nr:hypothetical protein [Aquimarina macrocephali]